MQCNLAFRRLLHFFYRMRVSEKFYRLQSIGRGWTSFCHARSVLNSAAAKGLKATSIKSKVTWCVAFVEKYSAREQAARLRGALNAPITSQGAYLTIYLHQTPAIASRKYPGPCAPTHINNVSPPALCCSRSRFPRQCGVFTCYNPGSCNVPTKASPAWILKYANVSVALDVSPRLHSRILVVRDSPSLSLAQHRVVMNLFTIQRQPHLIDEKKKQYQGKLPYLNNWIW